MTRSDRKEARRNRALDALTKDRDFTQSQLDVVQEQIAAFERNEKSLPQPLAAVQKQIQELKRELDRQNMEIRALEATRRTMVSAARFIDENPKDW